MAVAGALVDEAEKLVWGLDLAGRVAVSGMPKVAASTTHTRRDEGEWAR